MKPKGKKNHAKLTKKLENARRKLSLPVLQPPTQDLTEFRSFPGPSTPIVTSIFLRSSSRPFNYEPSLTSGTSSGISQSKQPLGVTKLSQRRARSTVSESNPTHAVQEKTNIYRSPSNQDPRKTTTARPQPKGRKGMTYDEARKALSLNNVIVKAKVNVNLPNHKEVPEPTKFNKPSTKVNGVLTAPKNPKVDVVSPPVVTETSIETTQQKMKRIRFEDEIPDTTAYSTQIAPKIQRN